MRKKEEVREDKWIAKGYTAKAGFEEGERNSLAVRVLSKTEILF